MKKSEIFNAIVGVLLILSCGFLQALGDSSLSTTLGVPLGFFLLVIAFFPVRWERESGGSRVARSSAGSGPVRWGWGWPAVAAVLAAVQLGVLAWMAVLGLDNFPVSWWLGFVAATSLILVGAVVVTGAGLVARHE